MLNPPAWGQAVYDMYTQKIIKPPYIKDLIRTGYHVLSDFSDDKERAYQFRKTETLYSDLGGRMEKVEYDAYKGDIAKESI